MPTTIQNLIPVQRSASVQARSVEPRSRDRKDDFQQHLDEAATNKPAQRAAPPAKSAKAEGKKPAGKAKGKAEADRGDERIDAEAAPSDQAVDEAAGEQAVAETDLEAGEAHAESDHDAVAEEDAGAEPKDELSDAAKAEAAALAQGASVVKPLAPVQDEQPEEGQQAANPEAAASATVTSNAAAAGTAKGPTSARVKAVDKQDPDAAAKEDSGEAAGDPTAALADAILKTSGEDASGSPEGQSGQQEAPAAPVAKKPIEPKADAAGLGLQQPNLDGKPEQPKGTAASASAAAPVDPTAAASMASQVSAVAGQPAGDEKGSKATDGADAGKALTLDAAAAAAGQAQGPQANAAHRGTNLPAPQPPEVQFADSNHEPIVTGVKAQLLPHGGSMQIRLDPPELGALKVMVEMRDGAMTATFQTSNEEATRLLSHSLNQLKHVLEGQGVNVERLQVQQAPKGDSASGGGGDDPKQQPNPQNWQDEHAARQEQQRKEVLRRMWRRVSGMTDPIDVTA